MPRRRGTWEEFGHPHEDAWGEHDYPGRENAQTASLLRGHYAGHFLSMLAHAYAGEQDEALRAKVDEFVTGLGEVQQRAGGDGALLASGLPRRLRRVAVLAARRLRTLR